MTAPALAFPGPVDPNDLRRGRGAAKRRQRKERVIQYERPWLYPEQEAFLFTPKRFSIVEASTKTGKTAGCLVWLVEQALLYGFDGWNGWWIAPFFAVADSAYLRAKRAIDPAFYEANDGRKTLTLTNGAVLWFKSADNPDSLFGEDVYAAVIDEATRCKETAWHAVYSTLTATGGQCRIIGNVKGRRNWVWKLGAAARAGRDDWYYAKLTAWHAVSAGIVAPEVVLAARRDLPEFVYRELYLAEPSEDGANPFGLTHLAACLARQTAAATNRPGGLAEGPVVAYGVDLARSLDYTVVVGLNAQGNTARFERWHRVPWRDQIQRLRRIIGPTPALFDATGVGDPVTEIVQHSGMGGMSPETQAQLAAAVIRGAEGVEAALQREAALNRALPNVEGYVLTSSSKQALMVEMALAVQEHRLGIVAGHREGPEVVKDEMESFEFQHTRTGVRYAAPEGMHDDTVIAYALANRCLTSAARHRLAGGRLVTL